MTTKLTAEQACKKVAYALKKAGFTEQEAIEIFRGLYYSDKQWNCFDLYLHLLGVYASPNKGDL
jgi:hypothetical protein